MIPTTKVVIVTTCVGSPWLAKCLETLKESKYYVHLAVNNSQKSYYDSYGLYEAQRLGFEEFILLHDSVEVKKIELLDLLFSKEGNVCLSPRGQTLMGKYDSRILPALPPPREGKRASVEFETNYGRRIPWSECFDSTFVDNDRREYKNGRQNMILENSYIKKYKGTWHPDMIKE